MGQCQTQCISEIMGHDHPSGVWIIGDVFLAKYYSEFDVGGERIGLATAVQTPPEKNTGFTNSTSSLSPMSFGCAIYVIFSALVLIYENR